MMATLRRFMALLLVVCNGWRRSHRKTGTHFSGSRSKACDSMGRFHPQKGSPAKRTGHTLRVAAQYIQKTSKNNGLFGIWLADFRAGDRRNRSFRGRNRPLPARYMWLPGFIFSNGRSRGCIGGAKIDAGKRLIALLDQEVLHHAGVLMRQDVAVEHGFSD